MGQPKPYEGNPDRKSGHEESAGLEYRFRAVEQRLDDFSDTLRAIAPVVRQVGNVEADVEHMQRAVGEIKGEIKDLRVFTRDLDKGMTDMMRSGRTENLKLIGIVVTAFTTIGGIVVGLAKTGQL